MKKRNAPNGDSGSTAPMVSRRTVIRRALGASVGLATAAPAIVPAATKKTKPPEKQRPQENDIIVYRFGDRAGEPVKLEDVKPGVNEIIQALPMDPESKIVRDGSRLNGINLVWVDPELMSEKTKANAAESVVGYSTVCTHQGCDLTQWFADVHLFECYCHHSKFDAANRGKPSHGPAQRKLAMLPLKVEDGVLRAAAKFASKVGFKK